MTEPALGPEEWRKVELWRGGKMIGGKVRGMVVLDLPPDHRHGAAACALYGQPYGFTQEDVSLLRFVADFEGSGPDGERLRNLADKVAALLPLDDNGSRRAE